MTSSFDSFKSRRTLTAGGRSYAYFSLAAAEKHGLKDVTRLPYSLKVLLENLLRNEDGNTVTADDIKAVAGWLAKKRSDREIAFRPARVLMQDLTGVPAVVDLAAMRDAMQDLGGDPEKINPLAEVDLVIDHSVMVDNFGRKDSFKKNVAVEYQRNTERYGFLRWGQQAFANFRVVPPGTGICHQVNLEYLGQTVWTRKAKDAKTKKTIQYAFPDTVVGTDSHTTMINGLAVLGWGVGGIEAEAAMLGQPISMLIPEVIGFRVTGKLARRRDRNRPRAHRDADAAQERRSRQIRRILRARSGRDGARRPRDDRQHGARIWRDLRLLPHRRRDLALSRRHRPQARARRPGREIRQGARPVPHAQEPRSRLYRHAEPRSGKRRAEPRRPAPAAGSRRPQRCVA